MSNKCHGGMQFMLMKNPYETVLSIVMTAFWSAALSVSCCALCDGMCAFDLMCKVLSKTLAAQTFTRNIDQQSHRGLCPSHKVFAAIWLSVSWKRFDASGSNMWLSMPLSLYSVHAFVVSCNRCVF